MTISVKGPCQQPNICKTQIKYAEARRRWEVFAAPNNIYSRESIGTNKLIDEGAKIYLNPFQLLLDTMRKPRVNNKIQNSEQVMI